ncbi:MAG TPA: hypothetical protein VJ208_01605 [Candidatus Nanoarchaeia archaeon]|nr:hypothetical protein [Candidatus Nanoarchaeia archaeon]
MRTKRDKKAGGKKIKVSESFVIALAIVSILGFVGIVSGSLFNKNINSYVESLLMIIIGIGLIVEAEIKKLKNLKRQGITPRNFTHLTTAVIGIFAFLSGVLSFPAINLQNSSFLAIKGIVSIIAIIFIIIQTWVIE